MIKEYTVKVKHCDFCRERIEERNSFYSTGRVEAEPISIEGQDICINCSNLILRDLIDTKRVTVQDIQEARAQMFRSRCTLGPTDKVVMPSSFIHPHNNF